MVQRVPIVKESSAYKRILNLFSLASGMEVNLFKSKIFSSIPILLFRKISPEFLAFKGIPFPPNPMVENYIASKKLTP